MRYTVDPTALIFDYGITIVIHTVEYKYKTPILNDYIILSEAQLKIGQSYDYTSTGNKGTAVGTHYTLYGLNAFKSAVRDTFDVNIDATTTQGSITTSFPTNNYAAITADLFLYKVIPDCAISNPIWTGSTQWTSKTSILLNSTNKTITLFSGSTVSTTLSVEPNSFYTVDFSMQNLTN